MEGIPTPLEIIESKERLKELETSGDYLFHGSPHVVSRFEPRQAYTEVSGREVPDGEPAVFASSEIEIPIFRSIFHDANFADIEGSFRTGFSSEDSGVTIHANQAAMDLCKGKEGYVYVFKREGFSQRANTEWMSNSSVVPVAVFHSSFEDIGLPITIEEVQ